jgi:hypothetical protein
MRLLPVLPALVLILAACTERPAWVVSPPADEPGRQVQVLAGAASEVGRLGDRACAQLAERLAAAPPATPAAAAADDRFARLRGTLPAVARIPEPPVPVQADTYFDGDRAWVLAAVVVGPWFEALGARVAELDRAAEAAVAALPAEPDPIDALRCWRTLAPLWAERDLITRRLAHCSPGRALPAEAADRAALERRLRALVERATVELVTLDAGSRPIIASLGDSLTKRGWRVVGSDGWARLAVSVATSERTIDGLLRLDGVLDGELTVAGEAGSPVHVIDRGDGGDALLARARLGQRLGLGLSDELDRRMVKAAER